MSKFRMHLLVCGGTSCRASESSLIVENLMRELEEKGLANEVQVITTGCFGFCENGPVVKILPENTYYLHVKPEDAPAIIADHVIKGRPVQRLLYSAPKGDADTAVDRQKGFQRKQIRIALRNCGFINPENIDEYIAREGYAALGKCMDELTSADVIDIIKKSGLRGRGGAGFPTGLKWEIASKNKADQKYVVCNADEGDPGAFMDRSVLEGDPHSVLEAMAICGYAIGASKGLIYIRAEYPLAIQRLKVAIGQAREYGVLGDNIFGTDFSFDIEMRYGAGAFVCGEETALIHSMEGARGEPTNKPPFPAESGFMGKPSNVNNVETFASVPVIINKGWEWYSSIGTEKSKGTKVFALAGKINNVGLIEVPMGTTLRDIIYEIGGGIKNGKKFKAVQTGGPSGGCLTEKHLDTPIDFDNLVAAGSMMGSGGMIVMDEDDCMVSIAKFFLEFTVEESCGKCAPCRIGNKRVHELLTHITKGNGTMADLDRLKNMCNVIKDTSLCGLGQTSPNPVLSTMANFMDEYEAHVTDKRCPAGSCRDLMKYSIIADKCVGCTACARGCPVNAITGERKEPHFIDQEKCIKCSACFEKCKFGAVLIN
ncbi:MAG: NADH-quinone oxidoreductase subunit NuoF [Bacteroidales bacterium]